MSCYGFSNLNINQLKEKKKVTMRLARDTAVQKIEAKSSKRIFGRTTHDHVNKMRGTIAAVYAEAKTSHGSFPLGSKFGFSAAILKKYKYIALHNAVATGLTATTNLATKLFYNHPIQPYMYDNTIPAVHTGVSRRKKESHHAELITQYEIFEGYKEAFNNKIFLPYDEAYLVTIQNEFFGFAKKLLPK